jgi:serine/threonine-protein kinase
MSMTGLPEKIGRYQILERVGRGGMGVLYRAFDPVLDREVAVKVMLADFSDDTEQMRPRFYREAKAAAKLQHRNIVTVFEFAEENNQQHIVMEFLRGTPLNTRMNELPPLTLPAKLDIVAQLCSGLGYAHAQGIVHRDVKPANVFLLTDGSVKLLDFGIAKTATSTLTQQGDVLGSAPYMSPEQVSGNQNLDGRSDIWSTGVLLYELLTGRRPFEGDALTTVIVGILKEEPPSLDALAPGLPPQLVAAVARALEKDPERRTPKAEELGRELQFIRQSLLASGELPPMDATRYASTNVLKALHDDRQKQGTSGIRDKTLEGAAAVSAAPAPQSKTWMIAAGAAALVLAAALGAWVLFGRTSTPDQQAAAPVSSPAAAPVSAAGGRPGGAEAPSQTPASTPAASNPAPPPPVVEKKTRAEAPPELAGGSGRAAAGAPATVASKPEPAAPRGPLVAVSLSAAYPFEVLDGSRSISAAATTHELPPQPNGKTLRLVAPDVFLDHPVRVDGGAEKRFEYSPPSLGRIDIRAARGDCRIIVGKRDLGFGPFPPVAAVAGNYQVSLACPDGQNPVIQTTVTQGFTARVLIK